MSGGNVGATARPSEINKTNVALGAGEEWTGTWEPVHLFSSVLLALLTDASGKVYMEFSPDGVNADSSLSFDVDANINEVHKLAITRSWYRVRYVNGSDAQSFMRLQTIYGSQDILTSPSNINLGQDADAILIRQIPAKLDIAQGRFQGISLVNKLGKNLDVNSNSTPEWVTEQGGVYTGFPIGSPDEFTVVSTEAGDTGQLTFTYLASATSESYQTATVTLQGQTPVNTGISGYRAHTMRYDSGTDTTFNAGTISLYHRNTPTTIFLTITAGFSQSNYCVYTVPYGSTAVITKIFGEIRRGTTATIDGSLWVRTPGASPRYRRPFTISQGSSFCREELFSISQGTDIGAVIIYASTTSISAIFGIDITLIKNRV